MNGCAGPILKSIHLLIGMHILLMPNLFCMQEQHCDECCSTGSPVDMNRRDQLNELSLQAYKVHLMALLISNGRVSGLFPSYSDASCLTQIIDIKRFRKEIYQGIAKILELAYEPTVLEYILLHDKIFGKFAALKRTWHSNKKKMKNWFIEILMTRDIESCHKLETEFHEIYKERIKTFHDLFSRLNMLIGQYYASILKIMP